MKRVALLSMLLASATVGLAVPASAQVARPGALGVAAGTGGVQQVQWGGWGRPGWGGGWGRPGWGGGWGGPGWGGGYYGGGWGPGAAVGAGVAGLAAGAIIGGAIAQSQQAPAYYAPGGYAGGDATAYCMQRFKSYDPGSGTYLGYDGYRHPCP